MKGKQKIISSKIVYLHEYFLSKPKLLPENTFLAAFNSVFHIKLDLSLYTCWEINGYCTN